MTVAADHVYTIAQTILAQVIDIYSDADIDLPTRRVISEGAVVHDCELVAIELLRVFRDSPNNIVESIVPQRCAGIRSAEYRVHIVRCTSKPQDNGDPPTPATINGFSLPIYTDAWVLTHGLQERATDGSLGANCDNILIGDLINTGPSGGFGGVVIPVQFLLGS